MKIKNFLRSPLFLFLLMFFVSALTSISVFAEGLDDSTYRFLQHGVTPQLAVIYLTPFIVWLAVFIIDKITPKLSAGIMLLIVAVVNIIVSFVTTLIVPDSSLWLQFALGFSAVFFNEVKKGLSTKKVP